MPIHIASMGGLMRCVLDKYGDDIHEGDIFIANDPHTAGGTHLPDINYAMSDLHRRRTGGIHLQHRPPRRYWRHGARIDGRRHVHEIYQEGLRIPVVKLFRRGELQNDIMELLMLNVRVHG